MSRAIQRLMKDYRKAEKLVGRSSNESFTEFANTASFTTQTCAQQMAHLRRDPELTQDEKKYLVAVERGDMATTRRYLDIASGGVSTPIDNDIPSTPININCLDPLGRSSLLIAIEYENIEMIELLLNYNIDIGEALLHAIDEEFVEAVELLLHHEDLLGQQQQQQQQQKNNITENYTKCPNNTTIHDKTNPLFTFAQVALDKEKQNDEHQIPQDISNKLKPVRLNKSSSSDNLASNISSENSAQTIPTTNDLEVGPDDNHIH